MAAELRRLNKLEYNNTVRDLLGVDLRPASAFPEDGSNFGFDNNANSLTTSGYLMELYLAAARRLVDAALASPQARAALIPCELAGAKQRDCVAMVLRTFARRAFRRPVTDDELKGLTDLAAQHTDASSPHYGVSVAMRAVLVSPSFLFRVETEVADKSGKAIPVNDYELGARLSYFLWSSMPDEALFLLAEQRQLHDPAVLATQVRRMLADPRARGLVDGFAAQWLSLRLLDGVSPSTKLFPNFGDELRIAMRTEAELFFGSFLKDNREVGELVGSTDIFIDRRLARHYGSAQMPEGTAFSKVVGVKGRGGLLRQGGWLTLTSKPTRTSAVVRGEWVLSHLLCRQPPPPPPGVEGFPTDDATKGLTQAQVLAAHRSRPECAGCHASMDVLGLAFENYDPVGLWRDKTSDGQVISAAGKLPEGPSFTTQDELAKILAADATIGRCLTEKLLTYALGRGPSSADQAAIESIDRAFAGKPRRFVDILVAVAGSDLVQRRSAQVTEN